jgi:hypothetical protein
MKEGRTISEIAQEIERAARTKVDFVAPTPKLELVTPGTREDPRMQLSAGMPDGPRVLPLRDLALNQIGSRVGIPAAYMERMRKEAPALLADNVNHWFQAKPENRMVRVLDNEVRAFLSNRYQRIDNLEVAKTVLPVLRDIPGLTFRSCEVTESRLYIKATTHSVRGEVNSRRIGDMVEAGIMISNSEVGLGAVSVKPFAMFLWCLNGAVRDGGKRWHHIGRQAEEKDDIYAFLTDETRQADDRALLLKVRDTVSHCLNQGQFDKWIGQLNGATEQRIEGDVHGAIKVLGDTFTLHTDERSSVLKHLIEGGDISRYGLMNAITRTAEDAASYDRATELETIGPALIDLPANQWRTIAEARPIAA